MELYNIDWNLFKPYHGIEEWVKKDVKFKTIKRFTKYHDNYYYSNNIFDNGRCRYNRGRKETQEAGICL